MEHSGEFTEYRGHRLREILDRADSVDVAIGEASPDSFPEAIAHGVRRDGIRWVRLPLTAVTARFKVSVVVRWRGEPFGLADVQGDRGVLLHGGPPTPEVAETLGIKGDQYYGWSTTAPPAELEHVETTEKRLG